VFHVLPKTILPKKFYGSPKMARIKFVTEIPPSVTEIMAPVTENPERLVYVGAGSVAVIREVLAGKRGRGRPRTGVAASDAERARKYRERRRAAVAAS
jgi:hypothetical protein